MPKPYPSHYSDPIADLETLREAIAAPAPRPCAVLPMDVALRLIREVERLTSKLKRADDYIKALEDSERTSARAWRSQADGFKARISELEHNANWLTIQKGEAEADRDTALARITEIEGGVREMEPQSARAAQYQREAELLRGENARLKALVETATSQRDEQARAIADSIRTTEAATFKRERDAAMGR